MRKEFRPLILETFPLIKLAKKLKVKWAVGGIFKGLMFPLIKLAKKLKAFSLF
jgi:hypothetical protein